jgi:uncharacterized protein (TIGR02118 family)
MIKTLAFIKRRPGSDRDAFRDHYETVHVPLALPLLEGLLRYVRYHVHSNRVGDFAFDVMTAFSYRDKAATDGVFARLASSEGKPILDDELIFMDRPANRFFAISERSWQPGEEGDEHLFVLVARPEGMSRFDASSNLVNDHWPRLLGLVEDPHFALLRDFFPMQGEEVIFDSVMQIGGSSFAGLEGWSKSLENDGFRVCAVETRRFESLLDV